MPEPTPIPAGVPAVLAMRTMYEAEADYIRDLAVRWQTYSYVAAGVGLVLGIIAASMRGYAATSGMAIVSGTVAYGISGVLFAIGFSLCGVLQFVARRLFGDIASARVDALEGEANAREQKEYVVLDLPTTRFMLRKTEWDRAGLPLGRVPLVLEYTPGGRVILAINGTPIYFT